ncbi:MAG TPA: response regulator transcription factor [Anaerolineae bacterium]
MNKSEEVHHKIETPQTFINKTGPRLEIIAEPLSERECEVLQCLASGATNREIGRRLVIAESTVKRHVYNIFGKLNVSNRTQAALRASELGVGYRYFQEAR